MQFEWNRSEVLALAKETCTRCRGFGSRASKKTGADVPCNCVFRAVFRACYRRFRYCSSHEKHISRARLEQINGKEGRHSWGLKDEEYLADFCLIAKRTLDSTDYVLFKYHFLLGADWKLCCRRLGIKRGDFFHAVYLVQEKLGRVFRELTPYPLYPLDEYFGGTVRKDPPVNRRVIEMPTAAQVKKRGLNPPLRKVA